MGKKGQGRDAKVTGGPGGFSSLKPCGGRGGHVTVVPGVGCSSGSIRGITGDAACSHRFLKPAIFTSPSHYMRLCKVVVMTLPTVWLQRSGPQCVKQF